MKTNSLWRKLSLSLALGLALPALAAEPKKILVVTVTTGFRHSSIATAEKVIAQLGQESGAFTVVDYARQPDVKVPNKPQKPRALPENADPRAKSRYEQELKKYESDLAKFDEAKAKSAKEEFDAQMKASLSKLSPENLKKYDGVIFANTTGDLPLPDKDAFIQWIKDGHAFVAMHSGCDTYHGYKPYIDMLGGEFQTHQSQVEVDVPVRDKTHPATRHLGDSFKVFDEIYIIKSYDPKKVHELLSMDAHPNTKEPGHYAMSWCKNFGSGKVFYTSLGHREDVWDPNEKNRKNPKEVAEAYQKHILGGIKWALGLEPGDATPQAK
jgi:type 1 glutamine amidotransferase